MIDDPTAILAALGIDTVDRATRIQGGWDTLLWRVEADGKTYALRVFRPEQAAVCEREALAMRALAPAGLPVPVVHARATWQTRPALLLSWISGAPLLTQAQAQPWRVWQLGVAMGRMHARIHRLPVADSLRRALPDWLARAGELPPGLRRELASAAESRQPSLLHLDFHPLNVMAEGGRITGVLDWANVAVGDRRADLARTVTILRLAPAPPGTPAIVRLLRRMLEAAWRTGYQAGEPGQPFDNLEPFYAWAGTLMERDLRPKLGRPGVWLQERDLRAVQQWTADRMQRAEARAGHTLVETNGR